MSPSRLAASTVSVLFLVALAPSASAQSDDPGLNQGPTPRLHLIVGSDDPSRLDHVRLAHERLRPLADRSERPPEWFVGARRVAVGRLDPRDVVRMLQRGTTTGTRSMRRTGPTDAGSDLDRNRLCVRVRLAATRDERGRFDGDVEELRCTDM